MYPRAPFLGHYFFLVYINDLPNCVSSSVHLFADDCVIFCEIISDSDIRALQSDIKAISHWCSTWHITLNTKKIKSSRISRIATNAHSYFLDGNSLEAVTSYKYLGVHISTDLSWKLHIANITNKTNRMLGYIRRNFHSAPASIKTLLLKSLVHSQLDYASPIWHPGTEVLNHQLEIIQNNSARFVFSNYERAASVSGMKTNLGLTSLTLRRKIAGLSWFHKIYEISHASASATISHTPSVTISHNQPHTMLRNALVTSASCYLRVEIMFTKLAFRHATLRHVLTLSSHVPVKTGTVFLLISLRLVTKTYSVPLCVALSLRYFYSV